MSFLKLITHIIASELGFLKMYVTLITHQNQYISYICC